MKKFAISLIALAAISSASFAGSPGDGTDTDAPRIHNNYMPNAKAPVADTNALSTGATVQMTRDADFYLNKSQLR
jgi:hypothetical protein